jgi:magnesium transporter
MEDTATVEQDIAVRDDDSNISPEFLRRVADAVSNEDRAQLGELTVELHEADLADLIEAFKPDIREAFVRLQDSDFNMLALTEVDDRVRDEILDFLPADTVAEGVRDLEVDDAVSILEDLDEGEQTEILDFIPATERAALRRGLDYPEDSAGRRMQHHLVAVPPHWTVGQTIDYMRETDDLPDDFYMIYIVDPSYHPLGNVALNTLLRTKRPVPMEDIADSDFYTVEATADQEEVARLFERYDLISAAVTDEDGRMVGVITVDDIIDVIEEEADEDIRRLAGVGDEEISDTILSAARSRITWLSINLVTAILASTVISLFDATIEQMVALAVLMPIVASMGGNAGTQTMTVVVRALATGEIDSFNVARVINREAMVGLVNGVVFALLTGTVTWFWFDNFQLALIIGLAMVVNMLAAGLAGIFVPLGLEGMNVDPAIASGTFVTTVTDVVGFFAFLGFAGWWLGLA